MKTLTRKQNSVLRLINQGKTTGEIANKLGITSQGVISHVNAIKAKGYLEENGNGNGHHDEAATAVAESLPVSNVEILDFLREETTEALSSLEKRREELQVRLAQAHEGMIAAQEAAERHGQEVGALNERLAAFDQAIADLTP